MTNTINLWRVIIQTSSGVREIAVPVDGIGPVDKDDAAGHAIAVATQRAFDCNDESWIPIKVLSVEGETIR